MAINYTNSFYILQGPPKLSQLRIFGLDNIPSGNPETYPIWNRTHKNQEPILRLFNLQLQRQRCSSLERLHITEK
jgi:hypothetical protein